MKRTLVQSLLHSKRTVTGVILCVLASVAFLGAHTLMADRQPLQRIFAQVEQNVGSTWPIDLTATGFAPQTIHIQPGDTVRWTNRTGSAQTVRSGLPQRLFLPLVVRTGGEAASLLPPARTVADVEFETTLQPGEHFSHTFDVEGVYPFHITNAPHFDGEVIVAADGQTATPTPTATETATSTATEIATATTVSTDEPSATPTPTETPTSTSTPTGTSTPTSTSSPTSTSTPTDTSTPTETATATATSTSTPTETPTEDIPPLPPDPADVAPPLDQGVAANLLDATSFLYTGDAPIQTGVVSGTIELHRAAVLRGRVLRRDGSALPGVTISVLDHPEFGQTRTRADGLFDLAVNGGGWLTVNYTRTNYLSAQRQAAAPWQDYVWLPDVVMIPEDPNVSLIDLTANIPMQVARGSVISDSDGVRQETLFFPQGTTAYMSFANGMTQTITSMHVRATEYTVGPDGEKSMPAELPPNSAYTYATIFHADEAVAAGAEDVWFDPPLISYVENFISFTVGIPIPMGYYDNDRGVWIPSDSGRVVKILSVTNNQADLDIDGSSIPASPAALAALGVTDAERTRLAELYPVGQSLWRVPAPHFDAPWDKNQAKDCESPCAPPPPDAAKPVTPTAQLDDPTQQCASIIGCETQTLGEVIGVVGAPFNLHYQSDRVAGHTSDYQQTFQLTGASYPSNLRRVELTISIAGRNTYAWATPAPNLRYTFAWDGKDGYGRRVQGRQRITVRLTYVFPLIYRATDRFGYNGASMALAIATERTDFKISRIWIGEIGAWNLPVDHLGGWSLDVHHTYDPQSETLYLGNGTRRSADTLNYLIMDTAALRQGVLSVVAGADGALYMGVQNRVYRMDPQGGITTFAGTGQSCNGGPGSCGDGGPATQARLNSPVGLALGSDGSLYIAEGQTNRVRRVGPDGIITTAAGNGQGCPFPYNTCFAGDGGPATQARLGFPNDVAVGPDGSLYIADTINNRVRRVDPSGVIHTVAGGGNTQPWTDGVPATAAILARPEGVEATGDGKLLILTRSRITRVEPDGRIWSVAGTGSTNVTTGDGALATQAAIDTFGNALPLSDGGFLFLERANSRCKVRRVSPHGILMTSGGKNNCSYEGDGGPALQASLNVRGAAESALAAGPDGAIYIADYFNGRVRRLHSALPGIRVGEVVIASEDGGEIYIFDQDGRHLRTLHALTGAVLHQFAYDGAGRLASIVDGDGNATTIQRDANGSPTSITGPYGQTTLLSLDANGYLAAVANPAGETTRMSYTDAGLMTAFTTPLGHTSTFSYTTDGRLIRDRNAVGGGFDLSRIQVGQDYTATVTSALGHATVYQVVTDNLNNQTRTNTLPSGLYTEQVKRADGAGRWQATDGTVTQAALGPDPRWGMLAPVNKTASAATPGGLTATMSSQRTATLTQAGNPFSLKTLQETFTINGRAYASNYNAATRTLTDTWPTGRRQIAVINGQGRALRSQTTGLEPLTYAYDNRGRLIAATQGSGLGARTATFTYNADGYLASVSDPLSRTVAFAYDLAGRVTTQTLPDGRMVGYGYDANGNLTSLTPPGRPAHTFTYTQVDLQASYTPPDIGIGNTATSYSYNLDRQLTRITRPDGKTVDVGYDFAGRPQSLTFSRGVVDYAYHSATGNLAGILAPGGVSLTLDYDGSLLTGQSWSGPVPGSVGYVYDNNFRRTSITVNGANPVAYSYDLDSLLTGVSGLTLSRNAQNGLLTGSGLGGLTDAFGYNGFGETISYTASFNGGALLGFGYEYDGLGRIVTRTETISGAVNVSVYGYDLAGRLENVRKNGAPVSAYTYDANGNRLSYTDAGGSVGGSYDAQDRLLQYGNTTYAYTANGELLTKTTAGQTTSYTYDELGNLVRVVLSDGTQIDYVIDGLNRRIGKKVNGALTQGFLYDGQLRIVAELDSAGNVVSRFVYATHVNVPDFMVKGDVTYRILTDHLGSPRLVVDAATGVVAQTMSFDEFGRVLSDSNPGFQPFGFAGGLYDRHAGLVRFGARDYDAEIGRWTVKDPIGFKSKQSNLYGYVDNEPINRLDIWGLTDKGYGEALKDWFKNKCEQWACKQAPESCCLSKKQKCELAIDPSANDFNPIPAVEKCELEFQQCIRKIKGEK